MKRLIRKVRKELNNPKKLWKYSDLYIPIRDDVDDRGAQVQETEQTWTEN